MSKDMDTDFDVPSPVDFSSFAENLPQLAWMADPEGWIFWYNRRWYEYTGATPKEMEGWGWRSVHDPNTLSAVMDRWTDSIATGEPFEMIFPLRGADGVFRPFLTRVQPLKNAEGQITRWFGTNTDISDQHAIAKELAEQKRVLETLNRTSLLVAAEHDLQQLVQTVTDAGVAITGAAFGAFFYNVLNDAGESYMLYTVSGVPRESFSKFPMPRNTAVFDPTFRGQGIVRSDDITQDPRYGRSPPYNGMPEGHLPVRSYLAVPVISRSQEVMGGLFFGHPEKGMFNARHEELLLGIAAQTAIGIEQARLLQTLQRELQERKKAEAALRDSEEGRRLAIEAAAIGTWNFNPTTRELRFDDRCKSIFGLSLEAFVDYDVFLAALHPDDRDRTHQAVQRALEPDGPGEFNTQFRTTGLEDGNERWVRAMGKCYFTSGVAQRFTGTVRDITDEKTAEVSRHLLLRELNHRVKNLFSIAFGMVTMTARTATSTKEMAEALRGRLSALARAHELISRAFRNEEDKDAGTNFPDLVAAVLAPHIDAAAPAQIAAQGPNMGFRVSATTGLAMVLHELATNAVKYGALSTLSGRLDVQWKADRKSFYLVWKEVGGPSVIMPNREGFGSQLVRTSVTKQLGGTIEYNWHPDGLTINFVFPLEHVQP
jgi:PAS domain S-box-containing protein